ncbi:MAG: hypothetical protein GYB31_01360 [Bacteroidetes bacterium]|nr:hypothetical protein [Bacteroidota bacterium]
MVPLLLLVAGLFIISSFPGTGDSGDSVYHYLHAHYAFQHPKLFLDHWAKPVFTTLSAPFAVFGFAGMKVFNLLVTAMSMLIMSRIGRDLDLKHHWLPALLLLLCPGYLVLIFSGLTEPLFALSLILSARLTQNKHFFGSALILSFMPFLRPEGLIFIGIFALYFLISKAWKPLLLLPFGHVFLAFAGWPIFGDPWWIFNRMTNAVSGVYYYPGLDIWHYPKQLFYLIGPIVYALFLAGIGFTFAEAVKKPAKILEFKICILAASVLAFITAHSIFWYFGIFKSMGLARVLICVIPLIAIFAAVPLDKLLTQRRSGIKYLALLPLGLALLFPFIGNKASLHKADFNYTADQLLILEMKEYLEKTAPGFAQEVYAFSHPSVAWIFDFDPFREGIWRSVGETEVQAIPGGSLVIWDNWFSVVEHKTQAEDLSAFGLTKLAAFEDGRYSFIVFRKE